MKVTRNPLLVSNGKIIAMPCTISHLAYVYQIDRRTMYNWLKPFETLIEPRITNYYTCKQLDIIFDKLGHPENYDF
jgi:hypothetical protein